MANTFARQSPITQTPQQRANTLYAIKMWAKIRPEAVYPRLATWIGHSEQEHACGTQACFGGHLPLDPYFQELGVVPDAVGAPKLEHNPELLSCDVSTTLFGDEQMFVSRGFHPSDYADKNTLNVTDHEIVRMRLQYVLNNSVVVSNDNV